MVALSRTAVIGAGPSEGLLRALALSRVHTLSHQRERQKPPLFHPRNIQRVRNRFRSRQMHMPVYCAARLPHARIIASG